MAENNTEKLAQILTKRGLLDAEQIKHVKTRAEQEGKSFIDIIRDERLLYPEQLAQVRADVVGVPYVDLGSINVDEKAMRDIPRQAAATYRFFAFSEDADTLQVAMEAPDDFQALEAVKFIVKKRGLTPEIFLASAEAIASRLGGAAEVHAEIGGALRDFSKEIESLKGVAGDEKSVQEFAEEAPVTKVVAVIIRHAIEGNSSDIHIEPTEKDLRIRYRIDGVLHTTLLLPMRVHPAIISRVKILSNLKIDESRLPQDGRFSTSVDNRSFDFRVSTMPTIFGEKVALRILDKSQGAPSFSDLGVRPEHQAIIEEHLQAPNGIVLISGPTGAGKSTTLFTALTKINNPDVNIATLEDPVEYEVKGVNQTQINPDIGLTFASGLRNLLRQDPDVLMVGEIRDRDTAGLSIHASLTGHLVLSTIHTNDAVGTVPRLVDMGIDQFLLAATLRLLAAQRLVAKLCQHCLEEAPMPPRLKEVMANELAGVPDEMFTDENQRSLTKVFTAKGCPQCHETGVNGRIGIFELVPVSRRMRTAINDAADYDTLQEVARTEGNLTMRQDGILKALVGLVHYEDVLRVTSKDEDIEEII